MPALDFNSLERPQRMLTPYARMDAGRRRTFAGTALRYASAPVELRRKAGAPGVLVTLPSNESPSSRGYGRVNALGQLPPQRYPQGSGRPVLRGMGTDADPSFPTGKAAFWSFLDNAMIWADRNAWIAGTMVVAGSLMGLRLFGVIGKFADAASSK